MVHTYGQSATCDEDEGVRGVGAWGTERVRASPPPSGSLPTAPSRRHCRHSSLSCSGLELLNLSCVSDGVCIARGAEPSPTATRKIGLQML